MKPSVPGRGGGKYPLAPTLLRVYLLVGVAVLAVAFLLYFQSLTKRLDAQTEAMSEVVARFVMVAATTVPQLDDTTSAIQFNDVVRRLDFPVILSDDTGRPMFWNESQVRVPELTDAELFEDAPTAAEKVAAVTRLQERLDTAHEPIPLLLPASRDTFAFVHYGSPPLSRELKWVPWVAIGVAALFGFTALFSLRSIKRAEQGFIWAGMAKESAHQMGTPISSLMGWVEVLRTEVSGDEETVRVPGELYREVVGEIERDAQRLNRVAARFSQIGSTPKLVRESPADVVQQTVDYFEHRLPRQRSRVTLDLETEAGLPLVPLNRELITWVLENLIKNAMDAADKPEGRVAIRVGRDGGSGVSIVVRDNGRGVSPGMEKQIFRPGVSTRRRGWGLGLALAHRIVSEYHRGRLELTWTQLGQGAEFTIFLPGE
jgi:hypothetical protein